jgi:hypothetical protein
MKWMIYLVRALLTICPFEIVLFQPSLAWPEVTLASSNLRPGQSCHSQLSFGLAWPRLQLLYVWLNFHVQHSHSWQFEDYIHCKHIYGSTTVLYMTLTKGTDGRRKKKTLYLQEVMRHNYHCIFISYHSIAVLYPHQLSLLIICSSSWCCLSLSANL